MFMQAIRVDHKNLRIGCPPIRKVSAKESSIEEEEFLKILCVKEDLTLASAMCS